MAAMLERNGKDGKPTPSNLPAREVIRCAQDRCDCSYTLCYTDDEYRMVGAENNVDKMHRTVVDLVSNTHPGHSTKVYLWKAIRKGPECGWLEADSLAVRAAL